MKILQINEVYKVLSTGRTTMELEEFLRGNGHVSLVAYAYRERPLKKKEKKAEKDKGHYVIGTATDRKVHALCSRISGLQGYYSYLATWRLTQYIKEQKPDIVHLRNVHGNFLNLNRLLDFLAKNDIPLVITLHDCWFYTGRCTHYTVNGCYQWREGCGKCPNNRNTPPSWFFDRCSKMWEDKRKYFTGIHKLAVIGVSDWITNQAKYSFLKEAYLIKRIYNWIDFDIFKPTDAEDIKNTLNLKDKFVILSVAAIWCNAKGLSGFLKLAGKLSDCTIILVGKINDTLILPPNIIAVPPTNNPYSLVRLYNSADVYVSLSREESFGKTVAEALACGTPVVACSSTALTELVGNHCGYTVFGSSLKGFCQSILRIRKNGKKFYSEHCIRYANKHFSKEACEREYIEVFEKLLDGKNQTDTK
ncbi:glycosyltransferase [Anaerocolumna xylanovorans]|uniref:Glycosyltransferase involved in cell wall bisynthesis n=1 Tax=Anaerocolumna xylanovorans DSM 12503 TaxID=1121345 RepID=A0A1M7Y218_9FIRM|nr:glycosyltransferase [Anaerocolumna xylanovorans]SHO45669.1 Glycosyltransferase involved in cell wall bisynthesis [Anaerocolumna xylanovorans DSM 12503]